MGDAIAIAATYVAAFALGWMACRGWTRKRRRAENGLVASALERAEQYCGRGMGE